VAGRRSDRGPRDHEDDDRIPEGEPVEILRVDDADEELGKRVEVEHDPLVPTGEPTRVCLDDHVPGLGERERHHRERDPRHPEAHRAKDERDADRCHRQQPERRRQAPLPLGECDRRHVYAEREVQGMPE